MKPKKIQNNIKLTATDIDAIICALPLVANIEAPTPEQTDWNRINCNIVTSKLLAGNPIFSADELRVISVAIAFALDVISGTGEIIIAEAGVDAEWKAKLSRHLFVYTRLDSLFGELTERIEQKLK